MESPCHFSIEDKFSSIEELFDKVAAYEKYHCAQLYRRDSKTLESAKRELLES